jgi:hypothetical protein
MVPPTAERAPRVGINGFAQEPLGPELLRLRIEIRAALDEIHARRDQRPDVDLILTERERLVDNDPRRPRDRRAHAERLGDHRVDVPT